MRLNIDGERHARQDIYGQPSAQAQAQAQAAPHTLVAGEVWREPEVFFAPVHSPGRQVTA